MMETKDIIKRNKEILKEIDELDKQYCKNVKTIAKIQTDNVLLKSKARKLRTGINIVRNIRIARKLSQEEKDRLITKVGKCEECGSTEKLTVHHKKKISIGGTNHKNNLKVLCLNCHRKYHPLNEEDAFVNGEAKRRKK